MPDGDDDTTVVAGTASASRTIDRMGLRAYTSGRSADHLTPPGHPERVERWAVMSAVLEASHAVLGPPGAARAASDEDLARVHTAGHLAAMAGTAGRATAIDPDTFTSPASYEVARLMCGAAIQAVDDLFDAAPIGTPGAPGTGRSLQGARALVAGRPPGHHAEPDRAMGFCLFNSIAVAAAHARAHGAARVAIVDYDVHHGNGTQAAFYGDPSVLFVSSHQFPYYPGTGAAGETGAGDGEGFTVNLPLSAGATDADFELVYDRVVEPVLRRFSPDLILVSAGFDAHADDPLGGMHLSAAQFARLTARLCRIADACAGGRIALVTEGGYNLAALADSLRAVIGVLADPAAAAPAEAAAGGTTRGQAALDAVPPGLRRRWTI
jgi:acetoin utilization deacetylase AcuC-like enzyme